MRNRIRVTSFAWMRRVHDVPAVVGCLPALVGETLEDRTLLSGVMDSSSCESSWADLLGSEGSLSFLLPADAVSGWLATDSVQALAPLIGDSWHEEVAFPTIQFRVDAQARWCEIVNLSARGQALALSGMALATGDSGSTISGELPAASAVPLTERVTLPGQSQFVAEGLQVLVTVEADGLDSPDGTTPLVSITVQIVEPMDRIADAATNGEPRFGVASGSDSDQPDLSLPISNPLATAMFSVGQPNVAVVGEVSGPSLKTIAVAGWESALHSVEPFAISAIEGVDPPASEFDELDAVNDLKMSSLESFAPPVTLLAIFSSATESPGAPSAQVTVGPAAVLVEPTVLKSFHGMSELATAFDSLAIVMLPANGLQAAAAPLVAVVETVLVSLNTTARTLLAMFTGSGGGTSPIAPVVEPIVSSSPVIIDYKRPRWALHDGVIEELAAYSLVIAPDQHFDLKEFGPASSAADPVVRIEFEVPPQHGQVSATSIPGSFQYSADPGFSGADTARFRVTRASGQSVAGAVTILVSDHDLMDRPPAPVRQVELPVLDQRLTDASFGLSDGGMDLP